MSLPESRNQTYIAGTTEVASADINDMQDSIVYASRGAMFDWGNGSDGDITLAGALTLTRDMQYNTLVLSAAAVLNLNGFMVKTKSSLTAVAGAVINVASAPSARYSAGAGAAGGAAQATGTNGHLGSSGGTGGPTNGGGGGGTIVTPEWNWKNSPYCFQGGGANMIIAGVPTAVALLGGGGGGGGTNGGGVGGTGGAGGGVGWIMARILNATVTVNALGSSGTAGVGGTAGGGGGGGGGAIVFVYQRKTLLAVTIVANGGAGGANATGGTASAGVNGPTTPYEIQQTTGFNASAAAAIAIAHQEKNNRTVSSSVVGEGGDYLDIVFALPFAAATGASGYEVNVTIKQTVAGAPVPSWSVKNATVNGMRIEFSAAFDGEVTWRAYA